MNSLRELQIRQDIWSRKNFPREPHWGEQHAWKCILGVQEEVGELSHAYLKLQENIRGNPAEHRAAMKDAIGDCVIFLAGLCNMLGVDFEQTVWDTWNEVEKRDWQKYPRNGVDQ